METEYRVGTIGAADAGAPHRRERIWIVAYTNLPRLQEQQLFDADLSIGPGDATAKEAGSVASQHPIGQLADTNVLGCLHGQAEVGPAKGGIHAQRESEPGGEDVADAMRLRRPGPWKHGEPSDQEAGGNGQASDAINGREGRCGWWSTEPGLGGMADELARILVLPNTIIT